MMLIAIPQCCQIINNLTSSIAEIISSYRACHSEKKSLGFSFVGIFCELSSIGKYVTVFNLNL
jgi:hypothetical protein